jgi:ERCC4-type nuclease
MPAKRDSATCPVILVDTREPWPHPWAPFWPEGTMLRQATLETGDLTLEGFEELVVVERKAKDLVAALGSERERFERELKRSRHIAEFAIVSEQSLENFLVQASVEHNFSRESALGTIASWTRRYCPILFCSSRELAARMAWRFLTGPVREAESVLSRARGSSGRASKAVQAAQPESTVEEHWDGGDAPF